MKACGNLKLVSFERFKVIFEIIAGVAWERWFYILTQEHSKSFFEILHSDLFQEGYRMWVGGIFRQYGHWLIVSQPGNLCLAKLQFFSSRLTFGAAQKKRSFALLSHMSASRVNPWVPDLCWAQMSSLSCICRECHFVCLKHLLFLLRFFHRLPHLGRVWQKNNWKQFWRFSNGNVGKKIYSNLYNPTTRTSLGKSAYGPMIVSWFFIPDFRSKKRPKKDVRGRWRSRGAWIRARIPKWRKERILSRRILQG